MDFRFKFRRHRAEKHEVANEQRIERDRVSRMRGLAVGMSIPMTLIAGPLLGWLAGAWLDGYLGTSYWTAVLIILGTIAGFIGMIEMLVLLGRMK